MTVDVPTAQERSAEVLSNDVSPLTSDAESDDDSLVHQSQDSIKKSQHDRQLLEEEDEREKLLTEGASPHGRPGFFNRKLEPSLQNDQRTSAKRRHKPAKRHKKRRDVYQDEEGKLIYELEDCFQESEMSSQASSSSAELDKLNLQTRHTSGVRKQIPVYPMKR